MKANACPFCGGTHTMVMALDGGPGIGIDSWYVQCCTQKCRASGPQGSSWEATRNLSYEDRIAMTEEEIERLGHEDAIRKWNASPQSSA